MVAKRITDEQWTEARKIYETTPGMGLGKIASEVLDCSKNLVVRKSQEQGWQKGVDATRATAKNGRVMESKFTEDAGHPDTQAVHVSDVPVQNAPLGAAPGSSPEPAPSPVAAKPAAPGPGAFSITQPPEGLSYDERHNWIRRECEALAMKINERHEKELLALQNAFTTEVLKGDPKDRGPALRLKALTESVKMRQDAQRASLVDFTKMRMGAFPGMSNPVRISVVFGHEGRDGRPIDCGYGYEGALRAMRLGNGNCGDVIDVEA